MSKVIFKGKRIVGNWKISEEEVKLIEFMATIEEINNLISSINLAKLAKNIDREIMSMEA